MQIPAILMAGGKGTRFDFNKIKSKYQEKLLLPLGEKYLIEHVIDAIKASKNINRLIIAVSPSTPQTKSYIAANIESIELIETPGVDFHSDLLFITNKMKLGITIMIAADIPLIKPEIIDDIIENYFILNKPALAVMADINLFNKYGLTPTIIFKSEDGKKKLVPLGINIIDGHMIDNQKEIEQTIYMTERAELLHNINSIDDFTKLIKLFGKPKEDF